LSELADELLPFKKAAMETWELAVAFVPVFRSYLKWAPLGFRRFIFYEEK
jgi:hypothetical protein